MDYYKLLLADHLSRNICGRNEDNDDNMFIVNSTVKQTIIGGRTKMDVEEVDEISDGINFL